MMEKMDLHKLIELGIAKGINLKKLIKFKERLDKKESQQAFYKAMSDFGGKKPILKKTETATIGKEKYNYIPLSRIQQQIDPILSVLGLSYRWTQEQTDTGIKVNCIVSHSEGYWEISSLSGPYDESNTKNRIQSIGSSVSYLKRYTLEAALGLSSEDDDDGKKALDKLPTLKANTKDWKEVKASLIAGRIGVAGIEKLYSLTDAAKKTLWDILREQLKKAFEEKQENLTINEVLNIGRIIKNKETLSYKKSLALIKNK